jgi:hypothetical protein
MLDATILLEIDVDSEMSERPSGVRTSDISVALPDGSIVAINESRCWTSAPSGAPRSVDL